jgi:ABC-type glycerol-3-phosphate transport system permease component
MRVALRFALAGGIALAIAGAITIFGFGSYERYWGKWGSLQVFLLVSIPYAFVCGLGAYAGIRFRRGGRTLVVPPRTLWIVSSASAVLAVTLIWIVAFSGIDAWWIYFIPFVVSLAGAWLLSNDRFRSSRSSADNAREK